MKDGFVFDVIIPVYRPDEKFAQLMKSLHRQLAAPRDVILLVTKDADDKGEAQRLIDDITAEYPGTVCRLVEKEAYDHAATRNLGVSEMKDGADLFLLMTQDAVPDGDHLTEKLVQAFADEQVACAYARQMADRTISVPEKCSRRFNYPAQSRLKTKADTQTLGIKAYFCSNVCAMYRREVFDRLGGFTAPAIFNEDMVYAAAVLENGYAIAYVAEARVMHAHDYTLRMQFRRSFDNGVSQAIHAELFDSVPAEKEGGRFVRETIRTLGRVRQGGRVPYFLLQCACRYAGFKMGRGFRSLPKFVVKRMSMNRQFWKQNKDI